MSIVRESEHHEHFACLPAACSPRPARLVRARPGLAGLAAPIGNAPMGGWV
jgi:hypothetical protein